MLTVFCLNLIQNIVEADFEIARAEMENPISLHNPKKNSEGFALAHTCREAYEVVLS